MFFWEVTGYKNGRKMVEEVKAYSQQEARQKFNRLNPDYTPGSAKRLGRV
jgi:hypothetical protein